MRRFQVSLAGSLLVFSAALCLLLGPYGGQLIAGAHGRVRCDGAEPVVIRAVVDRFEGQVAVLLLGDEEASVNLPDRYLPATASEGSVIHIYLENRPDETDRLLGRSRRRIRELR